MAISERHNRKKKLSWESPAGAVLAAALLIALIGCRHGNQLPVRGTVTLDGAPLTRGTINFRPAAGAIARSSGATILAGQYEISSARGLPPGKYLVTIEAHRLTGRMSEDPMAGGLKPEVAAVVFVEKQPFEVFISSGRNNVCDFRLTSAPQGK